MSSLEIGTQRTITPNAVYSQRPSTFLDGHQQDSSEYLGYLLDQLHKEEVQCTATQTSIVWKLFGGVLSINHKCLKCVWQRKNTEQFLDLKLAYPPLASMNQMTMVNAVHTVNSLLPASTNKGNYTAQSLLNFYFDTEKTTEFCDKCKESQDCERYTTVEVGPSHLVLIVKNFEFNQNSQRKLLHTLYCDEEITMMAQPNVGVFVRLVYKLYAVVVHYGENINSGHYYTYAANSANEWFKFDDSRVSRSSFDEINDPKPLNTPYILLYKLVQKEKMIDYSRWARSIE